MIDVTNFADYLKKSECIAITSYCNTERKLDILNRTIDNVKQYNLPVFIHAHYPLADEIQKKVHSYFYSSDNPILNRYNLFWTWADSYKLEIRVYDMTFTTLKGWNESIQILKDYERIHIINYDTNLTPDVFNLSRKYKQSMFLQNKNTERNYDLITYFCLNKKSFDYFRENLTLEKYLTCTHPGEFIPPPEEFVPMFTIGDDFFQVPNTEFSQDELLKYDIANENRFIWDKELKINGAKIFMGEFNNSANILFFDIVDNLKIEVNLNDKILNQTIEPGKSQLIDLGVRFKDIRVIKIAVNNISINANLIAKFFQLECKIYQE
jgi:hypothetical protein